MNIYTDDLQALQPLFDQYHIWVKGRLAALVAILAGVATLRVWDLFFNDDGWRAELRLWGAWDILLIGVSILLIIAGVWHFRRGTWMLLAVIGGLLIVLGVGRIMLLDTPSPLIPFSMMLYGLLVFWGVSWIVSYWRNKDRLTIPVAEFLALNRMSIRLARARPNQDPQLLRMMTRSGMSWYLCYGRLYADRVLLFQTQHGRLRVLDKGQLEISSTGHSRIGQQHVAIVVDGVRFKGTIDPESLARYQRWKQGEVDPALGYAVPWS